MAVKVGNSWVSETALTCAKSKADSGASVTLKGLSERYPNINFSTNTQPFSQKGTNNIQIAPSILAQMQNNPEKRLEYEALIYDCAQLSYSGQINSNGHIKAAGTIINADGSVSGWSISQDDAGNEVKHKTKLDKTKKDTWADKLKEKQTEKRAQEKRADNLSISSAGQESYKQLSSVSYQNYVDRFESHSTLMATNTEIWAELKNFTPNTVYSHSSSASNDAQTPSKSEAETGATQKGHIKDIAYKAFMSAISRDFSISASDRSLLNSIWNYYAK